MTKNILYLILILFIKIIYLLDLLNKIKESINLIEDKFLTNLR